MLQFGKPVLAKPADGQKVRKEDGSMLPAGGATVTHSSYYLRRRKEGVLTLIEVPDAAGANPTEQSDQSNPTDQSAAKPEKKAKLN